MIQSQIYRESGVAIAKGRVPIGPVGVFERVAAVRTIRETRRRRMEKHAVAATKRD